MPLNDAFEGNLSALKSDHAAGILKLNAKDRDDERTVLHWACSGKKKEVVEWLLSFGIDIDVNPTDDSGWTPLIIACSVGDFDIVKMLVSAGALVNHRNKSGNTALHYASSKGHDSICDYLISLDADVNAINEFGRTPLHRAAAQGHLNIVRMLANKGAKLDVQTREDKVTALHMASTEGHADICRYLVHRGGLVLADILNEAGEKALGRGDLDVLIKEMKEMKEIAIEL